MRNTPYDFENEKAPVPMSDSDWDRAALAGTRMLIAEESFDAMLQMLMDTSLVSKGCAAIMLERLSTKLMMHARGDTETSWAIRAPELIDQATRLSVRAGMLRTIGGRAA